MHPSLAEIRRARTGLLCVLGAFALNMVFLVLNGWVGSLPWLVMYPLFWLSQQVGQLDPQAGGALNVMAGYWGRFVLLIVFLAWGLCGLRPKDVGLKRGKWQEALLATVLMWAVAQVAFIGLSLVGLDGQGVAASQETFLAAITLTVKEFAGVGFFEEVFYRGLILPQIYLVLHSRLNGRALLASVALSQIFFALSHIPHYGMPLPLPLGLLFLWISGMLLAWMWLRTDNLLIAVGWHSLSNYFPFPFARLSDPVLNGVTFLVGMMFLAVWPWMRTKVGRAR